MAGARSRSPRTADAWSVIRPSAFAAPLACCPCQHQLQAALSTRCVLYDDNRDEAVETIIEGDSVAMARRGRQDVGSIPTVAPFRCRRFGFDPQHGQPNRSPKPWQGVVDLHMARRMGQRHENLARPRAGDPSVIIHGRISSAANDKIPTPSISLRTGCALPSLPSFCHWPMPKQ
jgi:hypothetical protein